MPPSAEHPNQLKDLLGPDKETWELSCHSGGINKNGCHIVVSVKGDKHGYICFTLVHFETDIIWAAIELPVSPKQEAQDQMRKWNIRFQQELTLVFVTRSRQEQNAGSSTLKHHLTSTTTTTTDKNLEL